MKKFPFFSILSLVLLIVLVSCEKETILSVDQSSVEISDAGGSATVSLTANKPWSASSNQSWCKVSPSAGEEATNSRITITCDPNTTYDARNCTVTFTCAELTKTVSVSQATNNGLLVSQTEYNITNAAQQLEIKVQANVKFSVEVDNGCKDWVKYKATKGLTTSTVVLDIAKNESYDNREGKVTIKQDGGNLSSTVVIKQGQTNGLFLTTSEYNLSNEKHILTVEVKSNIEFEVKSEVSWIKYVETKGLKTNQIILDVEANETYDTREGKVTVKQKNGDLTGTITIRQDQNYGILVTQSEYNLTNEAQIIDVEVKYNVDFDVIMPEECKDWIAFVSTKSLDSRTYTFSIAKNETYDDREGSITFKQKKGSLCGMVIVKQKQTDYIAISPDEITISDEKQMVEIDVAANVKINVNPIVEWIQYIETKGQTLSTIALNIDSNLDNADRLGNVIIISEDERISRTLIIHQRAMPLITTEEVNNIKSNSANLTGTFSQEASEAWFLYSEETNTLDGLKECGIKANAKQVDNSIVAEITNLNVATPYYYVACARIGERVFFGEVKKFITDSYSASVTTLKCDGLMISSCSINGFVETDAVNIDKAFFYYSNTAKEIEELITVGIYSEASFVNNSSFSSQLFNINPQTTYYYIAGVAIGEKVFWGNIQSFTTKQVIANAVDLGLSVKWATCNIGATSPEEYGCYYAWGETQTKSIYGYENYKWYEYINGQLNITKYCTLGLSTKPDNKFLLDSDDDVAQVLIGGKWRMPTRMEQEELLNNCIWEYTPQNGVNGYVVTSKINGNSIFLPETGLWNNDHYYPDHRASYLSKQGCGDGTAITLYFYDTRRLEIGAGYRYLGNPIRPVCEY